MPDPRRPGERRRFVARAARSGLRRYSRSLTGGGPTDGDVAAARQPRTDTVTAWADWDAAPLAATWLGHATVLLRLGGRTILTDPVLSERIGVRMGPVVLGTPRLHPVPVAPSDLPPIDLILISHAHFDHLDRPTLRALASPATRVITARGTRRLIPRGFRTVTEVDWEHEVEQAGIRLIVHRPAHWGARTVWDRRRGFNAYELVADADAASSTAVPDTPPVAPAPATRSRRILYAGDTAYTNAFDPVDPVDLAVFGIGAYDPWEHAHATPEQVWSMFERLGGRHLLPMHHSTFRLSDEPVDEPLRRLLAAADAAGERARVLPLAAGQTWTDVDTAMATHDDDRATARD